MTKETIYPNWSVYIVTDTMLKYPYSTSKRVKMYDYSEAIKAAKNVWKNYNYTRQGTLRSEETQVVVMEYKAPYQSRIKAIISNPIDLYTGQ